MHSLVSMIHEHDDYEYDFIQTTNEYGKFIEDWKGLIRSPCNGKGINDKPI